MKQIAVIIVALLLTACGNSLSAGVPTPVPPTAALATVTSAPIATTVPTLALAPTDTPAPPITPIATEIPSAPAPAVATKAPTVNPGAASYPCQPGQIKGNINSKIYHVPSSRDYAKTRANVRCFNTEAEAVAAGYRKAKT